MTQDSSSQEGFSPISPTLTVSDVKKASEFYENAFGFTTGEQIITQSGKAMWGSSSYKGITIMYHDKEATSPDTPMKPPAESGSTPSNSLYIYVDDVDGTYTRAIELGAQGKAEPEDMFWGDRMARVVDTDGYIWEIAKNIGQFDPTKLPPNWL